MISEYKGRMYLHFKNSDTGEVTSFPRMGVIKIGKLRSSHFVLSHESVARMHSVIEWSDEAIQIIDLGSSLGTQLNGERVKVAEMPISGTLKFGEVSFSYIISEAETPTWIESGVAPTSKTSDMLSSLVEMLMGKNNDTKRYHHQAWAEALAEEIRRTSPAGVDNQYLDSVLTMMPTLGEEKQRLAIRAMIQWVRDIRKASSMFHTAFSEFEKEFPQEYWRQLFNGCFDMSVHDCEKQLAIASLGFQSDLAAFESLPQTIISLSQSSKDKGLPTAILVAKRIPINCLKQIFKVNLELTTYLCAAAWHQAPDSEKAKIEATFVDSTNKWKEGLEELLTKKAAPSETPI